MDRALQGSRMNQADSVIKILHLSDIHMGSGLAYGSINPTTGINTRLEDFAATLAHCIDRAISDAVDLVLFGGDAFPDATPPPLHQDLFAAQFQRLARAGIPTVLLVGNHDQYGQTQAGSSLSIYRTLGVEGFVVGDRLQTVTLSTRRGAVQVTTLPWLTPSGLLAKTDVAEVGSRQAQTSQTKDWSQDLHAQLLQRLQVALEGEARQLDPQIPAILLAHCMVDSARYGSERHLAVGKGFTVPLRLLAHRAYQYVALGHVHKHQVLCHQPLMLYPGSPERVDFGEEEETKGFVLAQVSCRGASYEFIPLPSRPFRTLRLDLSHESSGLTVQTKLLQAIQAAPIEGSIVRLIYRIWPHQTDSIDMAALHEAMSPAFSYTIAPDVISREHTRLPGLDPAHQEPLETLERYLQTRPDLGSLRGEMVKAAQDLMQGSLALTAEDAASPAEDWDSPPLEDSEQLQLL